MTIPPQAVRGDQSHWLAKASDSLLACLFPYSGWFELVQEFWSLRTVKQEITEWASITLSVFKLQKTYMEMLVSGTTSICVSKQSTLARIPLHTPPSPPPPPPRPRLPQQGMSRLVLQHECLQGFMCGSIHHTCAMCNLAQKYAQITTDILA